MRNGDVMSSFTSPLIVIPPDDGRQWKLKNKTGEGMKMRVCFQVVLVCGVLVAGWMVLRWAGW